MLGSPVPILTGAGGFASGARFRRTGGSLLRGVHLRLAPYFSAHREDATHIAVGWDALPRSIKDELLAREREGREDDLA